ncbi:hypothetical protein [Marininema halotolerans]|uniref:Uncharacterized protein n=1 Tax=Marininema halotolerans TaxID=1155944 RepID=A0A1I6R8T8_9BACL|nr:hypothetical protein [Marininema halotolerans]SFS61104.1 hypothetical protein SAMN05444972_104271 [Marininema halotolerans]
MARRVEVKNPLITTLNYVTNFGYAPLSPLEIIMGIEEDVSNDREFVADIIKVQQMFNQTIGQRWSFHTLAQRGVNVPKPPLPVVRVNYSPSLENIARGVYRQFFPYIRKTFQSNLLYVVTKSTYGNGIFTPTSVLRSN